MTPTRLRLWTTFIIALAALFFLSVGVNMVTDWLWYSSVDHQNVYLVTLGSRLAVFFGAAIPFVLIFMGNVILARKMSTRGRLYHGQQRALDLPVFGWLIVITGLVLGLAVGLAAAPRWLDFQRFFHPSSFDLADPLFGLDVGFFIFSLPA